MRQEKYILEKKTYKEQKFIQKQDKLYKKQYPMLYRYHLFVKLKVIANNEENIFTVIYENPHCPIMINHATIKYMDFFGKNKNEFKIKIQNMDGYFYLNDLRRKQMNLFLKKLL